MKTITRHVIIIAIFAAPFIALRAAPLTGDTPVYASPDFAAPVLVTLGAGAEPSPATAATTVALPEGWQAIAITASIEAWVRDSDLNKELDVKPGSTLHAAPDPDSASIGTMVAGDVTELRGLQGKWVQMHVTKKTTGYINTTDAAPAAQPAASASAGASQATSAPAPAAPAAAAAPTTTTVASPHAAIPAYQQQTPSVPYAPNQTTAPQMQQPLSVSAQRGAPLPAATQQTRSYTTTTANAPTAGQTTTSHATTAHTAAGSLGGGQTFEAKAPAADATAAPRTFEGTFASTRRAFMPRRPYDFQLTAPDGTRLAYIDLAKITATEQFENYIGRTVVVVGPIAGIPNTQDIVIKAETLQAK